MTFPTVERVGSLVERWMVRIVAFCALGICLGVIAITYLLVQVSGLASDGSDARHRQQAVYPVTVKVYTWAANDPRSHVTAADLACVKDSRRCPALPKKTP